MTRIELGIETPMDLPVRNASRWFRFGAVHQPDTDFDEVLIGEIDP